MKDKIKDKISEEHKKRKEKEDNTIT